MTTILLALVIGAPGPKDASKPVENPLLGEWIVDSEVSSGKPTRKIGKPAHVTITNDRWKYLLVAGAESCLSVDPKKDPGEIDIWNPTQGDEEESRARGIYKLEGDTLTICYSSDKARPTKFESLPKSGIRLMTLKRIKKD